MKKQEVLQLIRRGENFRLEAKKAEKGLPASLWESYAAFCNTDGGVILLGVSENAEKQLFVSGVEDSDKLVQAFWNQINNKQKVSDNLLFNHQVYVLTVEDKKIVVVEVPRADRHYKPVFINDNLFGGTYRRNADGDYHCSREEVKAMLRDQSDITSDCTIAENVDWHELDKDSIYRFRMRFRNLKPDHVWNTLDDIEFLLKLGAVKRDRQTNDIHPTLAGILMLGTEQLITEQFPDYFLDYREMAEESRWTDRVFSSSGDWSGNVFDFYFRIIDRLTASLKIPFRLLNGLDRIDDTPAHEAVREALANALIHADYYGRRGIVVEKRKDRLSISNPGTLRITLNEALEGGISTVIFKMFVLINIGERTGSGLQNIRYVWDRMKLPEPQLKEVFSPDRLHLEIPLSNEDYDFASTVSEPVVIYSKVPNKVSDKVPDKVPDNLTDNQRQIVNLLLGNSKMSMAELARQIGISKRKILDNINKLKEQNLLRRVGENKTGYWEVL